VFSSSQSPVRARSLFLSLLLLVALLSPRVASAAPPPDTLDDIRKRGTLQWGGDEEGGGPYVFPREDDPNRVMGFEVDLAERIAEYLKVKPQFMQGNWDKMPDLLRTQKIDVILNGYEWTGVRAEQMETSIPYFIYALQLIAHKDDKTIQSFEDLRKPRAGGGKRRVGVLGGSAAQRYIEEHLGDSVEMVIYEGSTDTFSETQNGKIDACLQDTPIATFYAPRFPNVRFVGEPVGEGYYVILARKGDTALIHALNETIIILYRNGELERIYKKYGIWDARQEKLRSITENGRFFGLAKALDVEVKTGVVPAEQSVQMSTRKRGFAIVKDYGGVLLQSAGITVVLSVLSFPCAIIIGLLVAVGRLYGPRWLRIPLTTYVEFLRGTPLMLQLYFIFFFLPEIGIRVPAFATAIIGLAVNYSAYEAEVYRAGLQSIPGGQMEAALSLGMSRSLALRRIIVPQAVRIVIPPVVNDFIALFKDTSVCSVVTIVELTKRYSVLSMSTQATIELMLMTAVLYLVMSYPLSIVTRQLEKRFGNPTATA
jgi:polar amino acid transport system substrate-binding protein